jgi:hypothetical protein
MILLWSGCKQADTTQEETAVVTPDNSASERINPDTSAFHGGHDFTFLTHNMLHYDASSTVGKDPKDQPYSGQWIDMDPNGTFKAGKQNKQTHTGRWDYNHDRKVLLLRPDDKDIPASEWKVMHNEDMVVFMGTQTYGNNATQIKLVRSNVFPE